MLTCYLYHCYYLDINFTINITHTQMLCQWINHREKHRKICLVFYCCHHLVRTAEGQTDFQHVAEYFNWYKQDIFMCHRNGLSVIRHVCVLPALPHTS